MTESGYKQVDREDWTAHVGLCTITIETPNGDRYELPNARVELERETEFMEHRTLGSTDQVIPIRSVVTMTAVCQDAPRVPESQGATKYASDSIRFTVLPKTGEMITRIIRFKSKR